MRGKNSLALNSEVPPMHGQSDYIILLYCYWCWPEKGQKNEKERVHKVRNQDLWATNHLRVCLGKAVSAKGHWRRFVLLSSAWASHQELGMKDHCSTLNTHVKKEKSFIEAGKKKKKGWGDWQKGNLLYKDNTMNKNAREYWPLTAKRRNKSCFVSPRAESWFEMNESFR